MPAAIGFGTQAISDYQKTVFRDNAANAHLFCDVGIWAYSRHPNYFGEMAMWWGVFVSCIPTYNASVASYGYVGLLSPLLTMAILLFLSGVPSAEGAAWSRYMKTDMCVRACMRDGRAPSREDGRAASSSSSSARRWGSNCSRAPCSGRAAVEKYRAETSCIVPLPKCLYRALPMGAPLQPRAAPQCTDACA